MDSRNLLALGANEICRDQATTRRSTISSRRFLLKFRINYEATMEKGPRAKSRCSCPHKWRHVARRRKERVTRRARKRWKRVLRMRVLYKLESRFSLDEYVDVGISASLLVGSGSQPTRQQSLLACKAWMSRTTFRELHLDEYLSKPLIK